MLEPNQFAPGTARLTRSFPNGGQINYGPSSVQHGDDGADTGDQNFDPPALSMKPKYGKVLAEDVDYREQSTAIPGAVFHNSPLMVKNYILVILVKNF